MAAYYSDDEKDFPITGGSRTWQRPSGSRSRDDHQGSQDWQAKDWQAKDWQAKDTAEDAEKEEPRSSRTRERQWSSDRWQSDSRAHSQHSHGYQSQAWTAEPEDMSNQAYGSYDGDRTSFMPRGRPSTSYYGQPPPRPPVRYFEAQGRGAAYGESQHRPPGGYYGGGRGYTHTPARRRSTYDTDYGSTGPPESYVTAPMPYSSAAYEDHLARRRGRRTAYYSTDDDYGGSASGPRPHRSVSPVIIRTRIDYSPPPVAVPSGHPASAFGIGPKKPKGNVRWAASPVASLDPSDSDIDVHIRPSTAASRRSHPYQAGPYSDSESGAEDTYAGTTVYEFRPSRSLAASSADGVSDSELGVGQKETLTARDLAARPQSKSSTTPLRIYRSQYTGDALLDGTHSATLMTAAQESAPPGRRNTGTTAQTPLFRWLHLRQPVLNFEKLCEEVAQDPELTDHDRTAVVRLLTEVRKGTKPKQSATAGAKVQYMQPRYVQQKIPVKPGASNGEGSQTPRRRLVTWMCIPYFSLEEYSGLFSGQSSTSAAVYPNQTLWQAQYAGNSRERDMQQAVRMLGYGPAKTCFHVSQLWCIILDNSLLVTCGTMDEGTLRGKLIELAPEPKLQEAGASSRILVSFSEAVLWSFPVNECQTWFEFLSHFSSLWPQTLQFFHQDRLVTENDWPRKFNQAKHTKLLLTLKISRPPQPPQRGLLKDILAMKINDKAGEAKRAEVDEDIIHSSTAETENFKAKEDLVEKAEFLTSDADDGFHVYTWLEQNFQTADSPKELINHTALDQQMSEIDAYLQKETSLSERKWYTDCVTSSRKESLKYIWNQIDNVRPDVTGREKMDLEERTDIINAADMLFRFFFPADYSGLTVGKFWGAILTLNEMPGRVPKLTGRMQARNLTGIKGMLRELTRPVQAFQRIFLHVQYGDKAKIEIPDELIRSWLHLVMGVIHGLNDESSWVTHLDHAQNLLQNGMQQIMDGLSSCSLLDRASVLPTEIVSLICLNLLKDMTGSYPDISDTYSEYLKAMSSSIATAKQSEIAAQQQRLTLLKEEIGIIWKVLTTQVSLCDALFPIAPQHPHHSTHNRPHHPRASRSAELTKSVYYASAPHHAPAASYYPTQHGTGPPTIAGEGYDVVDNGTATNAMYTSRPRLPPGMLALTNTPDPQDAYKLNPTYWGGFRDMLATEVLKLLRRRTDEFEEYRLFVDGLERESASRARATKDRQEMAIYAFTIVTVVFLPLSAVAGIFGMNTSDIRDMEHAQWAYWAAAIPVTLGVIVLGLWWMGELGGVVASLGLGRLGGVPKGYVLVREPQPEERPYTPMPGTTSALYSRPYEEDGLRPRGNARFYSR